MRSGEPRRIAALRDLEVLDTAPEPVFDAFALAAATLCQAPIGLVSLIDTDRQWFKAAIGLGDLTETTRDVAVCDHTIREDAVLVVPDLLDDPRFADNPLVTGGPRIRAYAGAPLTVGPDRQRVGTVCVVDMVPREFSPEAVEALHALATATARVLDLRARARRTEESERALRESEWLLARTGSLAKVGGWVADLSTGRVRWTEEAHRIHGTNPNAELGPDGVLALFPEPIRTQVEAAAQRAVDTGAPWTMEVPLRRPDGREIVVRGVGAVELEDGVPVRLVGAVQDVTAQRRLEEARERDQARLQELTCELADQHALLTVTLESIGDAVITTSEDGRVRWMNQVAAMLTEWDRDEAVGRELSEVFHVEEDGVGVTVEDLLARHDAVGAPTPSPAVLVGRHGARFGIEEAATPIRDAQGIGHGVVIVFRDVTEKRRIATEMTWRATHDALTGLTNRSELEVRLGRALDAASEGRGVSTLLYIDLDQFKVVNDTCGHGVGDVLLRQVAELFRKDVRARDTLARLGGDEFAMILSHCPAPHAVAIAERIRQRMDAYRFSHDGRTFRLGVSVGLVEITEGFSSTAELLRVADASCYAAKDAGRNRVHVWSDGDAATARQHAATRWAARLSEALDRGRFALYGQRLQRADGAEEGRRVEVLLRLLGDDDELIPPHAFLPAAERFGLAPRIDAWVLSRTLDTLADLGSTDALHRVSVNLSGQSLGDPAFHNAMRRALRRAGRGLRERLCVEITETAAVADLDHARAFIDEVRASGVKVALDDFGAGASSFSYLRGLTVDELKIDGQYVRRMLDDPLDDATVRCFLEVAGVLGLETVAEHVDRDEVRDRLRELGVTWLQGHLLHRPEPLAAALAGC